MKIRLWHVKKIYNKIENTKKCIDKLSILLNQELKKLSKEDFIQFGEDTGYLEKIEE